jgi:AraC-like DNA-binding protein
MPIYMDVHIIPGVKARDVAEAHRKDLLVEGDYQCKCITYWIDEERENIFCLIDAPNQEAVSEMHGRAHGLIPNRIIEVNKDLVGSFLGRIYDPLNAEITPDGLKVFKDPSFRTLMITQIPDPALLKHKVGEARTTDILELYTSIIRGHLAKFNGHEVEQITPGFTVSFVSATKAVACGLAIQEEIAVKIPDLAGHRVAINAGEPVSGHDELFGDTLRLARYMCNISNEARVVVSSTVDELIAKDFLHDRDRIFSLLPNDEDLLCQLFEKLEENWQVTDFNVTDFCQSIGISKSQLYRKTVSFCGLSPVLLLKSFRLEKAKALMRKNRLSISEITFNSGFTSPSYFTKCFKKSYGLLPMDYMQLLH